MISKGIATNDYSHTKICQISSDDTSANIVVVKADKSDAESEYYGTGFEFDTDED